MGEALLVAPPGRMPDSAWFQSLLAANAPLTALERRALLSGRSPAPQPDRGRTVCACMSVGENEIRTAVRAGADSVEAVGTRTKAGTSCGSCRSEIRDLVGRFSAERQAG